MGELRLPNLGGYQIQHPDSIVTPQPRSLDRRGRIHFLRAVAKRLEANEALAQPHSLADVFERHARHLEELRSPSDGPRQSDAASLQSAGAARVVVVPMRGCSAIAVAHHTAAAFAARGSISIVSLGPVSREREEVEKCLAEVIPLPLFSSLLTDNTWTTASPMVFVVVTDGEMFLNNGSWARHLTGTPAADAGLLAFYNSHSLTASTFEICPADVSLATVTSIRALRRREL
jgi:hypothetical protein